MSFYLNFVVFTISLKTATADFEAISNMKKVNMAFLLSCRLWFLQRFLQGEFSNVPFIVSLLAPMVTFCSELT